MEITATLVKKLREKTDAPMMACKAALVSAAEEIGSIEDEAALMARAEEILREAGKAAAVKRADRDASNGTIAVATNNGATAAVTMLSETDFVAINEDFIALRQKLADHFASNEPGDDPSSAVVGGATVQSLIEDVSLKIRENIRLGGVARVTGYPTVGVYVHHDNAKASIVAGEGGDEETARNVAKQVVAFPSVEFISRDQVDQDRLSKEVATEKKRAIDDGKPEEIAEKIAQGRVNKEFLSQVVLLEMGWFLDGKQKVKDAVGTLNVQRIVRLEAGGTPLDTSLG